MPLKYLPFVVTPEIQKASQNTPALRVGMKGRGVTMLQSGLLDLGFKMPRSTHKNKGFPDGSYGSETKSVVEQFQIKHKLFKDGVAGKNTIGKLDNLLFQKSNKKSFTPASPPAPLTPKPPSDRNYVVGTKDPTITTDPGAGVFNSKSTEASMWALKQAILEILPPRGSSATIFIGPDAAMHMLHYLKAKGTPYSIRLEKMIADVPSAGRRFKHEVAQAKTFVEKLAIGSYDIASKNREGGYNLKSENKNWFFAVGGYSTWGKGKAVIKKDASGNLSYELLFEYHFYDRYNWDKGKSVTIGGIEITDEFMGEFHRQGLAREYDEIGMIKRTFTWKQGDAIPSTQYEPSGGR